LRLSYQFLSPKYPITTLLLSSSSIANPLPSALEYRQTVSGYQTSCVHDASIAFDDGPYSFETDLVDKFMSYGANATLFVNGYNYVRISELNYSLCTRPAYMTRWLSILSAIPMNLAS